MVDDGSESRPRRALPRSDPPGEQARPRGRPPLGIPDHGLIAELDADLARQRPIGRRARRLDELHAAIDSLPTAAQDPEAVIDDVPESVDEPADPLDYASSPSPQSPSPETRGLLDDSPWPLDDVAPRDDDGLEDDRALGLDEPADRAPAEPPARVVRTSAAARSQRLTPAPASRSAPLGPPIAGRAGRPGADGGIARPRPHDGPAISPRMTAIFGALFGLATVASIFALLIQVFPVHDQRIAVLTSPGQTATAWPTATAKAPVPKRVRVAIAGPWRLSALKSDPAMHVVEGEMAQRSFIVALTDSKVPKSEVYRVLKALDGVHKFDKTSKHEKFAVAMARPASKVVAFEYEVSPIEIYQAREDAAGVLHGDRLDLKVATEEITAAFYVGKDIKRSYELAGLEPGTLSAIDKALNGRISSEAFEEGGTVRAILVEQTALGQFVRYERATALEYRPADPAAKPVRTYYFDGETYHGYVDERGRAPSQAGWRSPIAGAPITSPFNPKRMHPVLHKIMPHQGTDFGATMGTPVYSAFRGTVESADVRGGYGNLVVLQHPGGISTYYGHLSRFAVGLKAGMRVGTHQLIAYVGSTGRSTGPHLHFGVKKNGVFVDSAILDLDAWRPLPVGDRSAFLGLKQQLDARLDAIPLPEPIAPEPAPAAEPEPSASAAASGSAAPAAEPPDNGSEAAAREEREDESSGEPGEEPAGPQPPKKPGKGSAAKAGAAKAGAAKTSPSSSGDALSGEDLSVPPD